MNAKVAVLLCFVLFTFYSGIAVADDVLIDSSGNVTTGVSNSNGNLEVTGASGEHGVVGETSGTGAAGVYGVNTTNGNYGILGYEGYGVYGESTGGWAGWFQGSVTVTGDLNVSGSVSGPNIGDITEVTAGIGLSGGAISGTAILDADTSYLQRRVNSTCTAGSSIREINSNGTVICETDDDTDTTYTAGTGLNQNGTEFSVSNPLALNGSVADGGVISGSNDDPDGYGVYGAANDSGATTNFGGFFSAAGMYGIGVYGLSYGSDSYGVYGYSIGSNGTGVFGDSIYGTGVLGTSDTGIAGYFKSLSGYGVIVENGNVGIGTTNPTLGLELHGAGYPKSFAMLNSTGGNYDAGIRFNNDGIVKWHIFNQGSNDLFSIRRENNWSRPVFAADFLTGRVGIGTTAPNEALTVDGTIESTSGGVRFPDGTVQATASAPLLIGQVPQTNIITSVDSSGDVSTYSAITIGADGLPVIAYYDGLPNEDLKVVKCGNESCSSGNTITTVDSSGSVGQHTSIAIGTDGLPVIAYLDNTNDHLKAVKCGNASCSSGNIITTVDTTDYVGSFTSIAIGTDGFPVISYRDFSQDELQIAKCGNASCSSGNTITTLDSEGNVGWYSSITIGTDGLPVISYIDLATPTLKVVKCGNPSCSSGNTKTSVGYAGNHGTSITIGADSLPVISYRDTSSDDLKVAKCGNASCSSGNTITTVDSAGDVGSYSSITIGPAGMPVISYQDYTNRDLKVVKCGNTSCSSANTITTMDSAGLVGKYTSITTGTDGLPVISYVDSTNDDIKVAKCANPFCLNNWTRR